MKNPKTTRFSWRDMVIELLREGQKLKNRIREQGGNCYGWDYSANTAQDRLKITQK